MPQFSHLHVHTQFSLLDGAADIGKLFKKAVADKMPALAITDHGNMFGVFSFVAEALKHKNEDGSLKVKPIIGCEFYVVDDRHKKSFSRDDKDVRYHQLLLAKNEQGYKNLSKLCSLGYLEGIYGKYPRIDKQLLLQYHEGLIATTCCLGAEVPRTIMRKGEQAGEEKFKWWLDLFGEDYYVELQRHGMKEQDQVNEVLLRWADKYKVKVIASNDSHYVDQADWNAHDILLCLNTGEKKSTPTNKEFSDEEGSVKGKRFAFYNDQFFFKTQAEMARLFADLPQALDNTNEIVDKTFVPNLKRDVLLPNFPIPEGFLNQMDYLRHLTYEGAARRYPTITAEVDERLQFELGVIDRMGFAGYFLIVADFIKAGRELGVFIGPGRGSAAGSAVAYCVGITNIDPIKYDLLFERFLNPERASMPDIDTDFDDEGRQKVIDYVVNKYGRNQVAHIITYGSMAARSSIKDVARVLDLPLAESNMLSQLVPDKPLGLKLNRLLTAPLTGEGSLTEKEGVPAEELEKVKTMRNYLADEGSLHGQVLKEALVLEGSVRNTGVHAAGIIIAPCDLTDLIPVATAKDSDLMLTQYEGSVIEDAGVLKMDFLGLRTLTIVRDALQLIKENHGKEISMDELPLDDTLTYELFQRAETNGIFQFESDSVKKYMRDLKPDTLEDLIALNALNRPGPMEYIPNYIRRKLGQEPVEYDLPEMEEYLGETYGITVYQEQVMLLSQKLGGFTKGEADKLRKAMGKKDRKILDALKPKFIEGAKAKNLDEKVLEKVWTDWEAFASYAFNKSHSTCYAVVAYQSAYLKAHYPPEFMAANLTNNLGSMDKITFFMDECRSMNIPVLGPDVNESGLKFAVNKKGEIRFGLAAIKGVGEGAAESILAERTKNGAFTDVFDFVRRVSLRSVNKRTIENLVLAGAFDEIQTKNRAAYFHAEMPGKPSFIEQLVRYGQQTQEGQASAATSLFGDMSAEISIPQPNFPKAEPWHRLEQLDKEKDLVGVYISGHPLDEFKIEMDKCQLLKEVMNKEANKGRIDFRVAGIISAANHRIGKSGKPYGSFVLEDLSGTYEFWLFSEPYLRMRHFLEKGNMVYVDYKMEARFKEQTDIRPNIVKIGLLADLQDRYTLMEMNISETTLNEHTLSSLVGAIEAHPGKCRIRINIQSAEPQLNVSLVATNKKVTVSTDLVTQIERLIGTKVVLN
ncbi:MAG: DNA polymerase III subunit alpha [Bacteroidia bacterium]|jgi:DNA polymerase-3 subunit alpha|nr:DNA polymerase III subunit alpha [Bacteroidia bacterium]MCC6767504.1 DNA polymerase III subunit alpha [Bacteroidia bacterium]